MATQPHSLAYLGAELVGRISRLLPLRDAFSLSGVNSRCLTASRTDPRIERVRNMAHAAPTETYTPTWDDTVGQTIKQGTVEELDIAWIARFGAMIVERKQAITGIPYRLYRYDRDQEDWVSHGFCQSLYFENWAMARWFNEHERGHPNRADDDNKKWRIYTTLYWHDLAGIRVPLYTVHQWVFVLYREGHNKRARQAINKTRTQDAKTVGMRLRLFAAVIGDRVVAIRQTFESLRLLPRAIIHDAKPRPLDPRVLLKELLQELPDLLIECMLEKSITYYATRYSSISTVLLLTGGDAELLRLSIDCASINGREDVLLAVLDYDESISSEYTPTVDLVRRCPDHIKVFWVNRVFARQDQQALNDMMKVCDFTCAKVLDGMKERSEMEHSRSWWVDVVRSSKSVAAMEFFVERWWIPEEWEEVIRAWEWEFDWSPKHEVLPQKPYIPLTSEMWEEEMKDTTSRWRLFAKEAALRGVIGLKE